MKDEIKEILDSIQEHLKEKEENFKKGAVDSTVYYLYCDNARILLDYITNLQEENESLHTRIKTIKRRRKAQTAKMRKYREEITNKQNSIVDYKSRIEKATKKLESIRAFGLRSGKTLFSTLINESIDILQGSDKD